VECLFDMRRSVNKSGVINEFSFDRQKLTNEFVNALLYTIFKNKIFGLIHKQNGTISNVNEFKTKT
jgi:hypothetical protein